MKTVKKHIILALVAFIFFSSISAAEAGKDVPLMKKEELKKMLDSPDIAILDVRRGKDWKSSEFKIKGAVYYNPNNFKEWASKYPKNKKLVLYCA